MKLLTRREQSWLPDGAWEACADSRARRNGMRIALSLDVGLMQDSYALIGCTLEDQHVFVIGHAEAPHGALGGPDSEVATIISATFSSYQVAAFAYDPAFSRSGVDTHGAEVYLLHTNNHRVLLSASQYFHDQVLSGELTHDGNTLLSEHIANTIVRETPAGLSIRKARKGRSIQLAVTATLAVEAARQVRGDS